MINPAVSIVIPCFNAEKYVGAAIESALGQTYPHKEVIVIDDGSTDGSLDVIRSFGPAVRWETGPNRGGCAARNRGIELARGELIQFLDADDLLKPEKLERQVPLAIANESAITYSDYEKVELDSGRPLGVHSKPCGDMDPVVFALKTVLLYTSSPLHWKRDLVRYGGFREDLKGSQEFELHVRLAAEGKRFIHVPQPLFIVRAREGSVSSNFVRTVGEQLKFLASLAADLERRGELPNERRRAFAERLAQNGRGCLQRGGRDVGLAFLREAWRLDADAAGGVYSRGTRVLSRMVGPALTERLVQAKRQVCGQSHTRRGL